MSKTWGGGGTSSSLVLFGSYFNFQINLGGPILVCGVILTIFHLDFGIYIVRVLSPVSRHVLIQRCPPKFCYFYSVFKKAIIFSRALKCQ